MLSGVKVGVGVPFANPTEVIPAFASALGTLLSVTPITPVVPDKSVSAIVSVGFLMISALLTV